LGLRDHGELGVLLSKECLRLIELLEHHGLDPVHHTVVLVLVLEVIQECLLRLRVTTDEERDADQDTLLQKLIIIQLCDVLTDELDSADLDQGILLGQDLRLEFDVIVGIPVGGGCEEVPVLYLHELSDNLQADQVKLLGKLSLV